MRIRTSNILSLRHRIRSVSHKVASNVAERRLSLRSCLRQMEPRHRVQPRTGGTLLVEKRYWPGRHESCGK